MIEWKVWRNWYFLDALKNKKMTVQKNQKKLEKSETLKSKVRYVVEMINRNKSAGSNGIVIEMFSNYGNDKINIRQWLHTRRLQ